MEINCSTSSPNYDFRENDIVDMIVIHSTHMPTAESMLRLCDINSKVSCHYLIDLDGKIYSLVQEDLRAWHAGESYWRGREKLNDYSVGIELVDTSEDGTRIKKFPEPQMNSLSDLCVSISKRYGIKPYNIVAHSDIAPSRKDDPGEFFDWTLLAEKSIGIYHGVDLKKPDSTIIAEYGNQGKEVTSVQELLAEYGYKIAINGIYDQAMRDVVIAFKRHFYPSLLNDQINNTALEILMEINKKALQSLSKN